MVDESDIKAIQTYRPTRTALQDDELSKQLLGAGIRTEVEPRRKKIVLFGHFGLGNVGNESTLQAVLYHLRHRLPGADISCVCTGPTATAKTHNIRAVPIRRSVDTTSRPRNRVARALRLAFMGIPKELYRWFKAFMTLKGTDVLIIPGTGLLTDAYGLLSWGPYNMFKWLLLAKIRGSKLFFVSVGAGPLYSRVSRLFVKSALALADYRSYRDTSSMEYLKRIGSVSTNDQVYPDLAFSLPAALIPHDGHKRRRSVVGLGLMEYAGKYSVENPSTATYRNYLDNLVILVGWLLARDYDVRLLIGDVCDIPVKEEFKCLLQERLPPQDASRIIDEPIDSVNQLLSQLAGTDFVVATRFHNVLLALLCNKPTIAISFHHKCLSLMTAMGLSDYCLDINDLKAAELIDKVSDIEKKAGGLKALIRDQSEHYREALEEQYQFIFRDV